MKYVAVDIETNHLDFTKGDIKLISLYSAGGYSTTSSDILEVKNILENDEIIKIFHNAIFDVSWLIYNGINVTNYVDTMIMAKILNLKEVNLKFLVKKYFDVDLDKTLQDSNNWVNGAATQAHKEYCLNDSKYTYELYKVLYDEIYNKGLSEVLDREIKTIPAMVELKVNGIKLDFKGWQQEVKVLESKANEVAQEFKLILGNANINLSSPQQIIEAFQSVHIPIKSTADDVLAQFEDKYQEVKLLRKYRKLSSQIKTFGYKISEYLDNEGVIRPNWNQIGAVSGRMSCSNPALQAVPSIMRQYFKAREDKVFVVADFSQIELRILAEVSKDETLIDAFNNDMDLHTITASKVFNKSIDEVTNVERKIGKSLNFGIVYGITEKGIQNQIMKNTNEEISIEEAGTYRKNFFTAYNKIYSLQNIILQSNKIKSLGGRIWKDDLKPNQKLNYCIQGTGADILKESLIEFIQNRNENYKLCAVVHDEIVIEVPEEDANNACEVLLNSMIKSMQKFVKSVPCKVDINISNSWCK